tara:strand:- start:18467 stop:18808 length:342 start_codon:yes stop_codon:yes gene_type:complete
MPYEGGYVEAEYYPDNAEQVAEHLLRYALDNPNMDDDPTRINVEMKLEESERVSRSYVLEIDDTDEGGPLSDTNKRILRLLIADIKNPQFMIAEYDNYSTLQLYKYNLYNGVR